VELDAMSLAEYEGPYREIWNAFNASQDRIQMNVFSINEDTAAAHEAKVAGGYLPAISLTQEMQIFFDSNNYEMAVDLSSFDFPWWDRFTVDFKNAWPDLYDLPGPRSLDPLQGYVFTWQYNKDLMDEAGLDPQADVKTWDDMKKWLDEGTQWAASRDDVDFFWNRPGTTGASGTSPRCGLWGGRTAHESVRTPATWARPSSTLTTPPSATRSSGTRRPMTPDGCRRASGLASGRATWRPATSPASR
jgi:hypothetical protein